MANKSAMWLVLMLAPSLLAIWTLVGPQPLPTSLLTATFLLCAWLYFRMSPPQPDQATSILDLPKTSDHILTKEEEMKLRGCFPWSIYYLQSVEYRQGGVICHGQLRYLSDRPNPKTNLKPNLKSQKRPTEEAYEIISAKIQAAFGDRFLVLLQESPAAADQNEALSENNASEPKYFFALTPNSYLGQDPQPKILPSLVFAIATVLMTLWVGIKIYRPSQLELSPSSLQSGLVYLLAAIAILAGREIARRFVAARYQVKLSLPYAVPFFPSLGTLGALTFYRSPIPHRRALFDLAIAPTLAGLVLALPMLIWGLVHSAVLPVIVIPASSASFLPFDPKISLLMAAVAQVVTLGRFSHGAIDLHPLAAAGWLGMVITAVGLIPVGNLEGGLITHAVFGQKLSTMVGQIARLLLLMLALLLQPWLLAIALGLFLLRNPKPSALDDVTELGSIKDLVGLLLLVLMGLVFIPVPKFLMPLLGLN
jgi:hypothetical protein